jgi:hypothetical protein
MISFLLQHYYQYYYSLHGETAYNSLHGESNPVNHNIEKKKITQNYSQHKLAGIVLKLRNVNIQTKINNKYVLGSLLVVFYVDFSSSRVSDGGEGLLREVNG